MSRQVTATEEDINDLKEDLHIQEMKKVFKFKRALGTTKDKQVSRIKYANLPLKTKATLQI